MKCLLHALGIAVLMLTAAPSASLATDSIQLAQELGDVIGSEEACGLTFDQAAIERFIDEKVREDDMSFTSSLNLFVRGAGRSIAQMSESARTAHCRQVSRVAARYGFIAN